ncbi:hypothetical protein BDN72DRAFT_877093 [Pluteus cervinus]|uniref:Uncharacterized protein n=1 Tax=Pluteus cervinus TaxID=181527 RepID=A0ACD3B0D3_9AGAR|nr:hypothetical protein BDN72DRAFT_877093 [Pluteus cervinus]
MGDALDSGFRNYLLGELHITRAALAGAFCLQVYDWLLNLGDEVELIHNARWSITKMFFLLCRYWPMVGYPIVLWAYMGDHGGEFCRPVVKPIYLIILSFYVSPQAVIVIRAYAFSGQNPWCLTALISCTLSVAGLAMNALFRTTPLPPSSYQLMGNAGCFPDCSRPGMKEELGLVIVMSTLTDLVSLAIVIYYCSRLSKHWAQHFVRQGFAFFACATLVNVLSGSLLALKNDYSLIGLPYSAMLSNIIACRVILGLKSSLAMRMDSQAATATGPLPSQLTNVHMATNSLWEEWAGERHVAHDNNVSIQRVHV